VNTKVIIGVVVVVLLAGVGYMVMSKSGGSSFTSIQDALTRSLSLECSFTDETGRQTKSYMKGGAVRADFTSSKPEESGSVIVKDKKMYSWNAQGGFMMELPDESDVQTTTEPGAPNQAGNMMESLEKYKESCKPAVVSDSLFTPPSNVNFQDFSKMMPQVPQLPTGADVPAAMPSIDYSQYLQNIPEVPQE